MVWNMFFPYIGNNHPNWLSYFLKGLKPPTRLAFIWVNYNDLTVLPHWNQMVNKVNHPQMAQQFRLVKPYTLPRFIMQIHLVLPPSPFTCWTLLLPSHVSWFKKHGVPYIFSETNPRTAPIFYHVLYLNCFSVKYDPIESPWKIIVKSPRPQSQEWYLGLFRLESNINHHIINHSMNHIINHSINHRIDPKITLKSPSNHHQITITPRLNWFQSQVLGQEWSFRGGRREGSGVFSCVRLGVWPAAIGGSS